MDQLTEKDTMKVMIEFFDNNVIEVWVGQSDICPENGLKEAILRLQIGRSF